MPKKKISYEEYLKVHGLLAMGHEWMNKVNDAEQALGQMLEPQDYPPTGSGSGGHCGDAIWSPYGADELLRKLEISVAPRKSNRRKK
jgi:hypothetical protein